MSYFASIRDEKLPGKLSHITNGPRGRKLLTGDKMGIVNLINSKSGELLLRLEKASGIQKREEADAKTKIKKSYEVTNVIFNEEQKILFTTSCDSVTRLYKLDTHNSEKLREFQGGHNLSEITSADYCPQTLMFYSGAANGTIAMWSVETSRLMNVVREGSDEITSIKNLFPYPAILVGDARGIVSCWRGNEFSTQGSTKQKAKVGDVSWLLFSIFVSVNTLSRSIFPIRSIITFLTDKPPQMITKRPQQSQYDQMVTSVKQSIPSLRVTLASYQETTEMSDPNKKPISPPVIEEHPSFQKLRRQFTGISPSWQNSSSMVFGSEEEIKVNAKKKLLAYCASQSGLITCFDIDHLLMDRLENMNEREYNNHRWERFHTNLYRHDNLDGKRTFISFMKEERAGLGFMLSSARVFLDVSLSCISWKAHHRFLNSISGVTSPHETILSCSESDFRIWGLSGESYCTLNMPNLKVAEWNSQYNFLDSLLVKLGNAVDMLAHISNQKFSPSQKDQLTAKFLWINYMWPHFLVDRVSFRKTLQQEQRKQRFHAVAQKHKDGRKRIYAKGKKGGNESKDLDINNLTLLEQATVAPSTPSDREPKRWPDTKERRPTNGDESLSESTLANKLGFNSDLAKQMNTKFNQLQFEFEEVQRHKEIQQSISPISKHSIMKSYTLQVTPDLNPPRGSTFQGDRNNRGPFTKSTPLDNMPHQRSQVSAETPQSHKSQEGPASLKLIGRYNQPEKNSAAVSRNNSIEIHHRPSRLSKQLSPSAKPLMKAHTMLVEKNNLISIVPIDENDRMLIKKTQNHSNTVRKSRNPYTLNRLPEDGRSQPSTSRTRNSKQKDQFRSTQLSFATKKYPPSGLPQPVNPMLKKSPDFGGSSRTLPQQTKTLLNVKPTLPRGGNRPQSLKRSTVLDSVLSRVNTRYRSSSSGGVVRSISISKSKVGPEQNKTLNQLETSKNEVQVLNSESIEEIYAPMHPQGGLQVNKGFFVRSKQRLRQVLE